MSTNRTLAGFLSGAALGATLGILFAPQSGKKTRKALMRRGTHVKDGIGELVEDGWAKWCELKGKAADAMSITRDELEDFVRYLMHEGKAVGKKAVADAEEAGAKAERKNGDARKAAHA